MACLFDPRTIGPEVPIGMFHCPECGEMVVAGMPHPDYSILDDMPIEEVDEGIRKAGGDPKAIGKRGQELADQLIQRRKLMRLEKHTEEEIEVAKEESGFANPTKEEIEEWKKIHDHLSEDMAKEANERLGSQITSLQGVILPLLQGKALQIARTAGISTVMELLQNKKTGVCFPWCKSELLGYEYITEEALEGLECDRTFVLCQYLCKLIEIDKGDTDKLEYWVKRFAATFSHLAENDKIKYGMLSTFMALPIADLAAENAGQQALRVAQEAGAKISEGKLKEIEEIKARIRAESKTRRILLMAYPYTHFSREELNEWLGNPAFTEEGDLGSDDWEGLPDV